MAHLSSRPEEIEDVMRSIKVANIPALVIALLCVFCGQSFAGERPNIILLYTDDQGYGDASCLNPDSKFQTPNIDRLAREGMTFTDGHCSDTVCTPSRYGLLTGRYSWRTELKRGVFGAERACLISDDRMTLASLLRDNGYHTAMVGKWHLGMDFPGERGTRDWTKTVQDMPLDKGFDYYYGIPASMNYGVLAWFEGRYAKVPPTLYTRKKKNQIAISDYRIKPPYERTGGKLQEANPRTGNIQGMLEVAPDFVDSECLMRFTDKAIAWIKSRARDARNREPFFVYLPFTSPHKPVIPIERFHGKSDAGAYGDFMIETDWHVGRILKLLDQEGLTEDTLVIFTSDNGPENTWKQRINLHQHFSSGIYRGGKRSIYEGGHRVPFLMRWPAKVKAGRVWNRPVCQTDLLATFAEMLDVELPNDAGEDSDSFFKVLTNESSNLERALMINHSASGRFAIRDGRWKLVMETKSESRELYDLDADPREKANLINQYPGISKRLMARITSIVKDGRSSPGKPVQNDTPFWSDLVWMN